MKKLLLALLACAFIFTGCGANKNDESTISVVCTLDPHSKILEAAKPLLEEKGYNLEITVQDKYELQNGIVSRGEQDANFFQHVLYFEADADRENLVNIGGVHLEPYGFYSKTITGVEQLQNGAKIIISSSSSDFGRMLSLLETANVITLKEGIDKSSAQLTDIVSNPLNLTFEEVSPELLTTAYENNEGDLVAINGNYALQGGLNPVEDAVILESAENNPYVNIVVCQAGHENDEKIKALAEVLTSNEIKSFIEETYKGSVISVK